MSPSRRFKKLKSRIGQLKNRLIPKTRIAGNYTAKENDLIRAFRLLVHAEFESYFEDRAIEIADTALNKFVKSNRSGITLAAIMTFSPLAVQNTPKSKTSKYSDPLTRVTAAFSQFKGLVSSGNNGIKEKNILSLFFPIGILASDLDTTYLNTLNSYGLDRGNTAHSSIHTQKPIDPVTEVSNVLFLINETEKFDAILQSLKSR